MRYLPIAAMAVALCCTTACRDCSDVRPRTGWDIGASDAGEVSESDLSELDDAKPADAARDGDTIDISDVPDVEDSHAGDGHPDGKSTWCDPSTPPPSVATRQKCGATVYGTEAQFRQTPRSKPRFEWLAIEATDAFIAPDCLYDRVERDLAAIDRRYLDSYDPQLDPNLGFPKHEGRGLVLYVDAETAETIENGTYDAWDCLNDHYEMKRRHPVVELGPDGLSKVPLEFEGTYDMRRLLDAYRQLPGLKEYDGRKVGFPRRIRNLNIKPLFDIRLDIDGDEHHYFLSFEQLMTEERPKGFSLFYCATTSGDGALKLEGNRDQPPRQDPPSWSELCNDTFDP